MVSVIIPDPDDLRKRRTRKEEELFVPDSPRKVRVIDKFTENQERAIRRVERESSLRPYRYVLTDYWSLSTPPVPVRLAEEKPVSDLFVEAHFIWVATGNTEEIRTWAEERTQDLMEFIRRNFEVVKERSWETDGRSTADRVAKKDLLDLCYDGLYALECGRLSEASGYLREAIDKLDHYLKEPLLRTGAKVRQGGKKGHEGRYGTQEEKQAKWASYQEYIEEMHRIHPRLSYAALTSAAASAYGVCPRTIRRHTKVPTK